MPFHRMRNATQEGFDSDLDSLRVGVSSFPFSRKMHFGDFELDERLLKALPKIGLQTPTLIQEKTIKFALESKDIVGKAKTGSGKTAAYCLPLLNRILKSQSDVHTSSHFTRLLIAGCSVLNHARP